MTEDQVLTVTLHIDGGARGNPGHAGIGVWAESDGQTLTKFSGYIGQATNNIAEYRALIKGLQIAESLGAHTVAVISDSELIVNQINGTYRVKNAGLLPLYQEARTRFGAFNAFQIRHVPRSENKQADRLANEGILKGIKNCEQASRPDGRARLSEESPSSTGQDAG